MDGELASEDATVSITVNPVNDPPNATAQSVGTNEDIPVEITLTGSDVENDPLEFIVTENPVHGTLTGTVPNLTYTPNPNYNGTDAFNFKTNDGLLDSESPIGMAHPPLVSKQSEIQKDSFKYGPNGEKDF